MVCVETNFARSMAVQANAVLSISCSSQRSVSCFKRTSTAFAKPFVPCDISNLAYVGINHAIEAFMFTGAAEQATALRPGSTERLVG
mmetsp:Transcript_112833/g.319100  ORF Transcript_112833/g.319100 Transcript_112833/m.319100 type:complete len:87 (+) Transcript_112833:220-480(+)